VKPYEKYTYSSTHLTVALDRDKWSASHPGCSTPEKVAVGSMVMSPSNKIKCQNWEVTDLICRSVRVKLMARSATMKYMCHILFRHESSMDK
jgi:hypothetical protein